MLIGVVEVVIVILIGFLIARLGAFAHLALVTLLALAIWILLGPDESFVVQAPQGQWQLRLGKTAIGDIKVMECNTFDTGASGQLVNIGRVPVNAVLEVSFEPHISTAQNRVEQYVSRLRIPPGKVIDWKSQEPLPIGATNCSATVVAARRVTTLPKLPFLAK